MDNFKSFGFDIYQINDASINDIAIRLFRFQAERCPVYRSYLNHLSVDTTTVKEITQIPFLPISFFKTQLLKTGEWVEETRFTSSGTTGFSTSVHLVKELGFYLSHARKCFEFFWGDLRNYHFLGLLPSYMEREHSSLISMMNYFIRESESPYSGFYLSDLDKLVADLHRLKKGNRKTILWGVSFALLDLAEKYKPDLQHCLVFETGGMKGRRKEITRKELHRVLANNLNVERIYSEYGMTELYSQAYTRGGFEFYSPPWLKVLTREIDDPFKMQALNKTGGINVIDLANFHSVSFIETEDSGRVFSDGTFELLGRIDNSDIRGCNLLVE